MSGVASGNEWIAALMVRAMKRQQDTGTKHLQVPTVPNGVDSAEFSFVEYMKQLKSSSRPSVYCAVLVEMLFAPSLSMLVVREENTFHMYRIVAIFRSAVVFTFERSSFRAI